MSAELLASHASRAGVRPALRRALIAACVSAMLVPHQATAHDWTSPVVAAAAAETAQRRPAPAGWPGTLWPGVSQAPAMPTANDCRRPPATFELAGYPLDAARPERPARPGSSPPIASARAPGSGAGSSGAGAVEERARADSMRREALEPYLRHSGAARAISPAPTLATAAPGVAAAPPPVATPTQPPPAAAPRPADEAVTAGVVDDNTDFGEYMAYRQRWPQLARRDLDLSQRVLLDVRDSAGRPVPDARVRISAAGRELPLWARTDAGGRTWLLPQPDSTPGAGQRYEVQVSKGGASTRVLWQPGQKDVLQARLDMPTSGERARLDLVFLVDATGSMGDEIDKLKRSMREVADQIARLPTRPDICFGLVTYRDRGDEYFVRGADLTNDLPAFQSVLERVSAGGGGDYPEALNEALHTAVHRISWRGEGTARLVVLVADAPPHLDYPGPQYDQDLRAAQARGIKLLNVGASGLNPQGEFIFRQMAQFTGGRFVFLTYAQANKPASGPGRETLHDVRNYSVETLDKLLVRLVGEEMGRWPQAAP
jgi:Mg-chelatase subunit ChlD